MYLHNSIIYICWNLVGQHNNLRHCFKLLSCEETQNKVPHSHNLLVESDNSCGRLEWWMDRRNYNWCGSAQDKIWNYLEVWKCWTYFLNAATSWWISSWQDDCLQLHGHSLCQCISRKSRTKYVFEPTLTYLQNWLVCK